MFDTDKYRKDNISWDTIDTRQAKIVYPIRSGIGMTGIYVGSVWNFKGNNIRVNLYGNNLKPENEKYDVPHLWDRYLRKLRYKEYNSPLRAEVEQRKFH